jgi:lambda family phage portal protein
MNIIRRLFGKRQFNAAQMSRVTADWILAPIKTNEDIRHNLQVLVMRSRDLAKNNSDYRKWLDMRRKNIFGPTGIRLRMKSRNNDGSQDKIANSIIEREWKAWGHRVGGYVSMDGQHSLESFCHLVDRTMAVDGEALIQKVKGAGPWLFSLHLVDSTLLDVGYNAPRTGGKNEITMGVERDSWGKPVAYYFRPAEDIYGGLTNHIRIPASEIIHIYRKEFAGQARGFPMASAAILDLNMVAGYREAELIGKRTAACQMGIWERPLTAATGTIKFGDTAQDEKAQVDFEPGKFTIAPRGWTLKEMNPRHIGAEMLTMLKSLGRSIANGLGGIAYNDFANDLEGVNFSSMRAGTLSERDGWQMDQQAFISEFLLNIFPEWLAGLLLSGRIDLPLSKLAKFNQPFFQPRCWQWVDPLKDVKTAGESISLQIASPQQIIESAGGDPEEVLERIAEWQEMKRKAKIDAEE